MKAISFQTRHLGINDISLKQMLSFLKLNSLDELINETIPEKIRLKKELKISPSMSEDDYLSHIKHLASLNKVFTSYIGQGYYQAITPSVILRNVFENPGWYTSYTPYQAEISQGRLEALLNFQTMICDLTSMDIANASLLDEGTAAAESMLMFYNARDRKQVKADCNKFFVSDTIFHQTKQVIISRAEALGIELVFGNPFSVALDETYFGVIIQYPDSMGNIYDYSDFTSLCRSKNIKTSFIADIMSLVILKSPGSWGADVVVGSTQRFGIPMGFGGPHAAYFACKEEFKRSIPGRIIGASIDAEGNKALRMALQTREQHIKRAKATSNICTAQALLAVMAGMYAVYHGPQGLINIAKGINNKAISLKKGLENAGIKTLNNTIFDTISFKANVTLVKQTTELNKINLGYLDDIIQISIDEKTSWKDLDRLSIALSSALKVNISINKINSSNNSFFRNDKILKHEVFNSYHSETEMMRYLKKLENKDLSLTNSMISLGSCTMKLNAATQLIPISFPEFTDIHPMVPRNQSKGYGKVIVALEKALCEITGFSAICFQPNSGAQGEFTGLMLIKAFHEDKGERQRNICLIPSSAHGTNPASAVMAGMKVVIVKCDNKGNIDLVDLKEKAEKYSSELSTLMITYPSTHGVFEESIIEITKIIHNNGGQVYMDGANMNAQVGLTSPGKIGADVCHLNLHKTFAIPHGGGGPGVGPIGVAKHLVPYLPSRTLEPYGGKKSIKAVNSAPYGSALILLISYGYIKLLGAKGLKNSTKYAILNANYLKEKLSEYYDVLYTGPNERVAHEMIIDCRSFKKDAGIEVEDIAKRLIDYGFHAPTVSFPVAGTLMIEPTESESKQEIDRFVEAMNRIYLEIQEVKNGIFEQEDNMLKNAPHTAVCVVNDNWNHCYTRKQAAFALDYLKESKYWSPVSRINNAHGDRNLICSCPDTQEYIEEATI